MILVEANSSQVIQSDALTPLCLQDHLQQKIVCPGVVTCLTASPDGAFLAAGVAEAIYLWEVILLVSIETLSFCLKLSVFMISVL